jgi:hypothetical protein
MKLTASNYKERMAEKEAQNQELLEQIKRNLPTLETLLAGINNEWNGPDGYYRFYHQSFKVYHLQKIIKNVVVALKWLMPDCALNTYFVNITNAGTAKGFEESDNNNWEQATGPIVTAFLHCRYVLEQVINCGKRMEKAERLLDSDWAAVLYIFNLR